MTKVKFLSEGLVLTGNLHTPENFENGRKYPAIIVDGSWTTVKEQMQGLYAEKLAAKGFVTLAFDHRYFGESEGQPREYENYETKVEDIISAVSYLQSLPFIIKNNIAGLGVCAGGAYMIQAVAEDHRLKALAIVVPWLMTPATAKLFYGGDTGVKDRIDKALEAKQKYAETGITDYVPAYDPQNMDAAMFFPVNYYAKSEEGAVPSWRNNFAVMSWEKWLNYDGLDASKFVDVPVIVVGSVKQFLPEAAENAYQYFRNDSKKALWLNDFQHEEFYNRPEPVKLSVDAISEYLHQVLSKDTTTENKFI